MSKKKTASANQGIIADNVTADVLAVGYKAKATKKVSNINNENLMEIINSLKKAIEELSLEPHAYDAVKNDLDKLDKATQNEQPDKQEVGGILQSIAGKLKMVGVVLNETVAISDPIKKLATPLGTTIKFFGF